MDSDDPEARIRELERLADVQGRPSENVSPGLMPPPPPGVYAPGYNLLRRQMDRRRRVRSIWLVFVVPGILMLAVLVFHPYRVQTHSIPSTSWSGAEPTADTSHALTVGPGGNLTAEPSRESVTFVCNHGELTIGGNTSSVYVAGHCAHLIVKGSHNNVFADAVDAIDTDGSGNHVAYHSGTPQITVRGSDNTVNKG